MIAPTQPPLLLQICANDLAPFAQICDVYAQAALSQDVQCTTIFLEQRAADPVTEQNHAGQVRYLSSQGSEPVKTDHKQTGQALAALVAELGHSNSPTLTLSHRHRSYQALNASGIRGQVNLVVAHEFGMFDRWQRRFARRWLSSGFQFAGISGAVADELAQVTGQRLVLPNGLDHQSLQQRLHKPDQALVELQAQGLVTPGTQMLIGVIGRLHRKKRPHLALAALEALAQQPTNPVGQAHLLYVGDGTLRNSLEQRVAQGNLPVTFCGFIPDAPSTLTALNVLLMTSEPIEAFGMVALEALTAGLPVVAPKIPGPMSVLGKLGFYYADSEDEAVLAQGIVSALAQVQALYNSPDFTRWQQQAQQRVRDEFSIAATAKRLAPYLTPA
jgi:glycosyltransferase involved in cell wall biosynthesis